MSRRTGMAGPRRRARPAHHDRVFGAGWFELEPFARTPDVRVLTARIAPAPHRMRRGGAAWRFSNLALVLPSGTSRVRPMMKTLASTTTPVRVLHGAIWRAGLPKTLLQP